MLEIRIIPCLDVNNVVTAEQARVAEDDRAVNVSEMWLINNKLL